MDSKINESGLHLKKKKKKKKNGYDGITSCIVATRTNLIPSINLTHAERGMESVRSMSVSLSSCLSQTSCSIRKIGKRTTQK